MSTTPTTSTGTTAESHHHNALVDFFTQAGGLKTTSRTGWVRQHVGTAKQPGGEVESVADHSWRMALMALALTSDNSTSSLLPVHGVDAHKLLRMAVVHDLAEAVVGDLTPYCGVSDADKFQRERDALAQMTAPLFGQNDEKDNETEKNNNPILQLWHDYEQGTSPEARLCKDLDKLEMTLQALEYEQRKPDAQSKQQQSLDGFFDSTRNRWKTNVGTTLGPIIEGRRRGDGGTNEEEEPAAAKKRKVSAAAPPEKDTTPPSAAAVSTTDNTDKALIHARVGFIGLGAMGWPMARNVHQRLAAGPLHVYDVNDTAVATAVRDIGAVAHTTPAAVAQACDIVVTMLPNDAVLHKVVHDPDTGLLAGRRSQDNDEQQQPFLHIGCSTVHPDTSRAMAQTHAYVGAPVFARADGVALRQASIVVGTTDTAQLVRAQPVLDAMAAQTFVFGTSDAGAGNVVKVCGNFLIAATIQASAEACALAEHQGVDRVAAMDMLSSTIFDCLIYKGYGRRVAHRQHVPGQELVGPGFGLALGCKDVRLARQVGGGGGETGDALTLPLVDLLLERWQTAVDRGWSSLDWSAVALLTAADVGKDVTPWLSAETYRPHKKIQLPKSILPLSIVLFMFLLFCPITLHAFCSTYSLPFQGKVTLHASSRSQEDLFAAVHRKEYEMRQVKSQHSSTTDPVRMAMSYAQETATPMKLAKALRRVYDDKENPAHPEYQEPSNAQKKRKEKLQEIGMAELGMRRPSFIADIKRMSKLTHPGSSAFCQFDDAGQVAQAMVRLGADAVFVNTDFRAYGGDMSELKSAVRAVREVSKEAAVVMKDIVVDEIQLGLAKDAGADGIVLMSSVLGPALENFLNLATTIGLETIVECHTKNEVEYALQIFAPNILVNNYDRIRQELHPNQAIQLAGLFPGSGGPIIALATGGIGDTETMKRHLNAGYDGIVVGQAVMGSPRAPEFVQCVRDRMLLPATLSGLAGDAEFDVEGNLKDNFPSANDPTSFQ